MDVSEDLPLEHVSRPGTVESNAPAVVLIHGRGANERDLLPIGAQLPEELHVLAVRAPRQMNGPNSYTWYDLDLSAGGLHASQPESDGFRQALDLLHDFVPAAIDHYDLDADRIGILGFSQGAITGLSALIERPEAYRWVVALNGYLTESHRDESENAADKPVFLGCGSRDQIIPPNRAEDAAEQLESAGADVRFERYPVGHGTTPEGITDVVGWLENLY